MTLPFRFHDRNVTAVTCATGLASKHVEIVTNVIAGLKSKQLPSLPNEANKKLV